ncbi:MAG: DUF2905 domain-containing protein [Bacteroidota bacterium]
MNPQIGKYVIFAGLVIVIAGVLIYAFGDKLGWLGKLPGDIRVKREGMKFYIPITTMILVSVILTVVVNLIRRFL